MKIGILKTGRAPHEVRDTIGDYDDMFTRMLADQGFRFETWAVVDGVFPEGHEDADGWLITGSRHGAYEDHPWIPPLEELIRAIHASGRPMIGVCFGHQIMAQALGGKVEKFSGGWSVGRVDYRFRDGTTRAITAWHQDQVTELPEGAEVVAESDFCRHAALLYPGRAYSVQPHPEFGHEMTQALLDHRAPGVVPDDLQDRARAGLSAPLDQAAMAAQFAHFLRTKELA